MFAPQLNVLSDEFRVIAYDHRARTDRALDGPYDLDDLASDWLALLDALRIDRCLLVGMSMGGFMALRCALRHADRLVGVVLIGASARPYTEDEQHQWDAHYAVLRGAARVPRAFAEDEARYCFGPSTYARDPGLVEHWVDRWTRIPGEVVYHEARAWMRQDDITGCLGQIMRPVLAIHGAEDAAVAIEHARATVAALPDARLVELGEAGHTVNLERSDPVNAALRDFAREVYERV